MRSIPSAQRQAVSYAVSYGRVKQNVDGCLFVWTGGGQVNFFFF